jgi:cysteinyl-tRNA synthetase
MLSIHNTLKRKKELFKPLKKGNVNMYVCGPTVYGPGHIGHARTYIAFDIVRRYLEYRGNKVKLVMNITDIHDDVITAANEQGITLFKLADKNTKLFFEDLDSLKIKKAFKNPRVTEHIPEIIALIKQLEKNGYTYSTKDGVYYDISRFPGYGKLSGAQARKGKTGQRVQTDKYDKEHVQDFVLWKKQKEGEPAWDSPWGKGRPGWHIECSAMAQKYLGKTFDIHAGAIDLVFPHHENEVAQSEGATGKSFVRYWMHGGLLMINGQKMAKSLGNYATIPQLLEKHSSLDFRMLVASVHYKSILDYNDKTISDAGHQRKKWNDFIQRLLKVKETEENTSIAPALKKTEEKFEAAMDDDFGLPNAWAALNDFQRKINGQLQKKHIGKKNAIAILKFLKHVNTIIGVLSFELEKKSVSDEVKALLKEREQYRKEKKWKDADKIRDTLLKKGIQVMDTDSGTDWEYVKK